MFNTFFHTDYVWYNIILIHTFLFIFCTYFTNQVYTCGNRSPAASPRELFHVFGLNQTARLLSSICLVLHWCSDPKSTSSAIGLSFGRSFCTGRVARSTRLAAELIAAAELTSGTRKRNAAWESGTSSWGSAWCCSRASQSGEAVFGAHCHQRFWRQDATEETSKAATAAAGRGRIWQRRHSERLAGGAEWQGRQGRAEASGKDGLEAAAYGERGAGGGGSPLERRRARPPVGHIEHAFVTSQDAPASWAQRRRWRAEALSALASATARISSAADAAPASPAAVRAADAIPAASSRFLAKRCSATSRRPVLRIGIGVLRRYWSPACERIDSSCNGCYGH